MDTYRLMNLHIGMDLQLSIEGISFPVKTRLIGLEPNKFIIIRPPASSQFKDVKHKLFPGNRMIVRYLVQGEIVAFSTTLNEFTSSPAPLLFLSFPKKLIHRNIRSAPRAACMIPVIAQIGDRSYSGIITDISMKGCQCVVTLPDPSTIPDKTQSVDLHFKFLGKAEEQKLTGEIKNLTHKNSRLTLGLKFNYIQSEFVQPISEYIDLVNESL